MRINCPHCGVRGVEEFAYHGDATLRRPAPDAAPEAWADYVYLRDNPAGRQLELWYHAAGCHAWLVMERDTRTHEIFSATPARDAALSGKKDAA
jgi:heterotetrameric sarcosine oxidase delta subunit